MRVAIVGSRRRMDQDKVEKFVKTLDKDDIVISGGCHGVDTWAIEAASRKGLQTMVLRPDLAGCTSHAEMVKRYYERNRLVANNCDMMVAFVAEDRKGGTENAIQHAKRLKKKVIIL